MPIPTRARVGIGLLDTILQTGTPMQSQVLIFSPRDDAHATAIRWALTQKGLGVHMVPAVNAGENARASIWASEDGLQMKGSLIHPGSDLRSVWYRRPRPPEAGACHEADRGFISGQWLRLQDNVFSLAGDLLGALWINEPEAANRAENKLMQLRVAQEIGLVFPDTVVSNDAREVRTLLQRWPRVVFKTFYPYNWKSESTGSTYNISVKLLDASSELPEEAVAMCPGIFQRYIEKAYDIRVTVIGDRFFAVRMRKGDGSAYVDWRKHMMDEDLFIEECSLPADLEEKLRVLMRRLGLVYGAIDLVVTPEGDIYFLEINQSGQFLFVEEALPTIPLLDAMTSMLASGRVDYSMDNGKRWRFADYMRTDDYQEMVQAQMRMVMSTQHRAVEA